MRSGVRCWRSASWVSAITFGTWSGALPSRLPPPYTVNYLLFWTLYAICAWAWMVALLGIARRWLNTDGVLVRFGRRVGYGMYIVHQPIIVAVAYVVVQTSLGVDTKFVITLIVSSALTLGSAYGMSCGCLTRRALGLPEPTRLTGLHTSVQ